MAAIYRRTFDADGNPQRIKDDFTATTDPDANDDASTGGWTVGSLWMNTATGVVWFAESVGTGTAVWNEGGGSAGTSLHIDLTVSGAHTIDYADGATHDLTLTGNATFTLDGALTGKATDLRVILRQDGTGNRTVTWPGSVEWIGGSAPTLQTAADAVDVIGLLSVDDGTTWLGFHAGSGGASDHGALSGLADDDHPQYVTHTELSASNAVGPLIIADVHSTPIIFADLVLTEDEDDFVYGDV